MVGTIKDFYAGGNTAHGFVSLMESSLQGLDRIYILLGPSDTVKSDLIQSMAKVMTSFGYECWRIHSAADNESLDSVVIPLLKIGMIVGKDDYINNLVLTEGTLQYIDLGDACDLTFLNQQQETITRLNDQMEQIYQQAYAGFAEALRIHDEWEALYIAHMNFQEANELTNEYVDTLYGDRRLQKESRVDHRFLGAATHTGAVDYVPNLTQGLKRYLMKGRPGSGKSTMLKKIAAAGIERGFDIEIYHCGFDSNSLDMVIARDLGFAIFDSTAPHEYFPDRATDVVVDMYTRCIDPGTDEVHAEVIGVIKERYSTQMQQSIQYLTQAKAIQDELEEIYTHSLDCSIIDRIKDEIQHEITDIAALAK
ncbi:PRK06851 family protein [Paenibacillus crassostreae]|uniref:ATPase n=1 Tax=Paenibacillus crassostreae TaxID=1763538 RepID=A0A167ASF5_9BACL|nr:PRK06851 family protein [Paenibacillus crassostreae]AOZ93683.1 hypothetical protein LPB68_16775 [Paenibacillus crassostreae]OAB71377.1 hypothetical protein PNBC_19645 [Paenibacillus crassostreae]